jgi:hypothetical protein
MMGPLLLVPVLPTPTQSKTNSRVFPIRGVSSLAFVGPACRVRVTPTVESRTMRWDRILIGAVVVLQLTGALAYASRKRYAEAVMFVGAAVANAAALFIEGQA